MTATNTAVGAAIAKQFGIKPSRIRTIKTGVFKVQLANGDTLSLKRMPVSVSRLQWIDRRLQALRRNGFRQISWRSEDTPGGNLLYVRRRHPYVLTPWVAGRWPSPRSSSDMYACGVALARFHLAGGKPDRAESGANVTAAGWAAELRARRNNIKKLIRQTIARGDAGVRNFWRKHEAEVLSYADQAIAHLRKSRYEQLVRAPGDLMVLCHGDGGPTNFIMNAKGTYLIDFETLRIDLRAYDLYRVLYNSCKDHRWNFAIAEQLLTGYHNTAPLTRNDIELLKVWLRFPRTTHLMLRQWMRNHKLRRLTNVKAFRRALAAERKMADFMAKLDRYAERRRL